MGYLWNQKDNKDSIPSVFRINAPNISYIMSLDKINSENIENLPTNMSKCFANKKLKGKNAIYFGHYRTYLDK